jgi:serine/threonine-protein kinase
MTPPKGLSLTVACPACGKPFSINSELAGRPGRCPHCNTAFRTPTMPEGGSRETMVPPPLPGQGSRDSSSSPPPPLPRPAAVPPPSSRAAVQPGLPERIGPYNVSRELGRGAFGVVYQGFDAALKRDVAIKVLNRTALGSQKAVDRFLREAQVVAGMHHNHIVPVYQLGEHEGGYYIASRFIPGKSLTDAIPEDGLPAERAVPWAIQLLDALAYAHAQGVMHRDVKPDNALLDEHGQLFLTDFGLAGWVGQAEMTQDGSVMGTPVYMAPEQARGTTREVGAASDQYSASVVLYELLTGHRPFESGNIQVILHNVINTPPPPPSEWKADLDPELEAVCMTALAKHPDDRFASCADMAQALRDWQEEHEPVAPLVVPEPTGTRPRSASVARQTHASVSRRATQVAEPPRPPLAREDEADDPEQPSRRGVLLAVLGLLAVPVLGAGGYVVYRVVAGGSGKGPGGRRLKDLDDPDEK